MCSDSTSYQCVCVCVQTATDMKKITLVFILIWSSGTHPASVVYVHFPEEVTTVHNGTTGRACGVPAIKPVVSGCPSDGLGIINGEEAVPHSWPWQVSLQTWGYWGKHFCGGSLINKDWVVTAAHCGVSACSHVILGQHNLRNKFQKMNIGKVFNHPKFNSETLDYDITLIKLRSPAQMNKHVSPVCVAETNDIFAPKCVVTGWGRTSKQRSPDKLQQVCMPLVSLKDCNSFYPGRITPQMLCAGADGADTCNGDSGGPLVCKQNGAWTLVGVTSWRRKDCATDVPSVYTNVPNLRAWMDEIIANN